MRKEQNVSIWSRVCIGLPRDIEQLGGVGQEKWREGRMGGREVTSDSEFWTLGLSVEFRSFLVPPLLYVCIVLSCVCMYVCTYVYVHVYVPVLRAASHQDL